MPTTQRQVSLFSCFAHLATLADPRTTEKEPSILEITKTLSFVQRTDPEFAPVLEDLVKCSLRLIGGAAAG